MSDNLAYISSPGVITKILSKIKEARTPDRFNEDFLQTKLGFKGGNNRQFIPLAKKMGFLHSDGSPTDIYKTFRNDSTSKAALAEGMRNAFSELFERNEYAYNLKPDELKGLVVEITGLEKTNRKVQLICQTFQLLNKEADFEMELGKNNSEDSDSDEEQNDSSGDNQNQKGMLNLSLGYNIQLILPKTDDPAVYNAIFKSLRENLFKNNG